MNDTIAAIATPPGRGGVGIVRISGDAVCDIAPALLGNLPKPRFATLAKFTAADGTPIDQGLALYFAAPASYTGEHVLELHGHGGPVVLDQLLARVLQLGARPAQPGEFTERAFHNGKLDLSQAEAVADLIDAGSQAAARAANRSLSGEFAARIQALVEQITQLRVYVEAAMDFPDEDIDFLADDTVLNRVDALAEAVAAVQTEAGRGRALTEGLTLVLAGRPNTGKSSLLNRLAGTEAAIVTDIAGTTRDSLREHIVVRGIPITVVDTAGIRDTDDAVERIGVQRARDQAGGADAVLLVVDDSEGYTADDAAALAGLPASLPVLCLYNKSDLSGAAVGTTDDGLRLSAKTGDGVEALELAIAELAGASDAEHGRFSARRRHLDAIAAAVAAIHRGREQLVDAQSGELLAEELRLAQDALGRITGAVHSDDLLGEIFSSFCIGK
ncbi:tRNA uridine-5-carboxymethylaminomethyl(34) synthesis GTPase MnmE [bacterium]|nr:tRNA uridine-5-carboxymethylaminomethyl(34) synthesis GTPase MnmE [bacterium]